VSIPLPMLCGTKDNEPIGYSVNQLSDGCLRALSRLGWSSAWGENILIQGNICKGEARRETRGLILCATHVHQCIGYDRNQKQNTFALMWHCFSCLQQEYVPWESCPSLFSAGNHNDFCLQVPPLFTLPIQIFMSCYMTQELEWAHPKWQEMYLWIRTRSHRRWLLCFIPLVFRAPESPCWNWPRLPFPVFGEPRGICKES